MKKETIRNKGKVVTFYSYKGGTGRSMALANVACLLAQDGKKVLMIDWDLEAPGLVDYFKEYVKNTKKDFSQNVGLIEFMQKAFDTLPPMPLDEENEDEINDFFKQINDYILPIKINANKNLFLMKAGRMDETYSERIAALDWSAFFKKIPVFFTRFAFFLREKYDFVLIDSRTGHTDTGGICTMLMPEKLVLAFTPNDQSLNGVLKLAKRATDYRINSDDLRPLEMYPLASRFDIDEDQMRKDWKKRYVREFGELFKKIYALPEDTSFEKYFDEVQIRHVSKYSYGEKIAVLEEKNDLYSISTGYQNLKEYFNKSIWSYEEYKEVIPQLEFNEKLKITTIYHPQDREDFDEMKLHVEASEHLDINFWGEITEIRDNVLRLSPEGAVLRVFKGEQNRDINHLLNISDIILILVSPDLLASNAFNLGILPVISDSIKNKIIVPIILRPCYWENTLRNTEYPNVFPDKNKTIKDFKDNDFVWKNFCLFLKNITTPINNKLKTTKK